MKNLQSMIQNTDLSYKKTKRPTITVDGETYEVMNCYTKEEINEAEYLILRDSKGLDFYQKTKLGVVKENERALQRAGLSRYVEEHTLDKYIDSEQWQKAVKIKAMEYINNPDGWFFISGQSGSGKTHICNAIAIQLMKQGKSLKHMTWFDDVNRLKYHMEDNYDDIDDYTEPDILYIDDFLKTRKDTEPSDIEVEIAYQILDARYRRKKLTIISTEKSMNQIESYDTAVFGRILEMSRKHLIHISKDDSKNYRKKEQI